MDTDRFDISFAPDREREFSRQGRFFRVRVTDPDSGASEIFDFSCPFGEEDLRTAFLRHLAGECDQAGFSREDWLADLYLDDTLAARREFARLSTVREKAGKVFGDADELVEAVLGCDTGPWAAM